MSVPMDVSSGGGGGSGGSTGRLGLASNMASNASNMASNASNMASNIASEGWKSASLKIGQLRTHYLDPAISDLYR